MILDFWVPLPEISFFIVKLIVLIGLVLGLGLAVGYALVLNYFDRRIKTPEDIEERNINLLGWVPRVKTISGEGGKKGKEFVLKNFTYSELAKRYIDLLESTN